MCGITGYVDFHTKPNKANLKASLDQIIYRGPDSFGEYIDDNVALGIRRLSIIDLKTGDQPITNEAGNVTVVFNGEIYNFVELRTSLTKDSHKFKTNSDTEVLVHLYEKYGEEMPGYLNGMFAFAIWDKRNQKLFLARDPAGIKPLYFWHYGEKLIFGSEIKTLLKNPLVNKEINPDVVSLYSYFGYIPDKKSIFKNIYKLQPGNTLIFSKKGIKIKKYYKLLSNNKHGTNLEELFYQAVKLQSIADVPLGIFLSGGLDSSLITYYLTKITRHVKTFSISFDEKSFDEGGFAREVAFFLKTDHNEEKFYAKDVIKLFPEITQKLDEPLADPSFFPTYKISKFARKYVKVVLSGDGGDELFGGYPTYQGHLLAEKINFIPKLLARQLSNILTLLPKSFENYPRIDIVRSFLFGFYKPAIERQLFWMSLFATKERCEPLVNREILNKVIKEIIKNYQSYKKNQILERMGADIAKKMQFVDFSTYLTDDLLTKVDRASMFNSLEVRVPFLDPDIISFAFSTKEKHIDFFQTKKIIRNLLTNKLPDRIINRRKKGFGIPISRWLLTDLYDLSATLLENKKLDNYFNRNEISRLWLNHQNKKENNGKILWMLVMFSAWIDNWGI